MRFIEIVNETIDHDSEIKRCLINVNHIQDIKISDKGTYSLTIHMSREYQKHHLNFKDKEDRDSAYLRITQLVGLTDNDIIKIRN
jgi:hypothetical protein